MVVVRTNGELYGEHREGDGPVTELHGPFQIESNADDGTVKTRTKRRERELRGTRLAMSAQLIQRVIAEDLKAEEYAKSPPRAAPKPTVARNARGPRVPEGYRVCPGCSTGMTDPADCPACEGHGLVRSDRGRCDESA